MDRYFELLHPAFIVNAMVYNVRWRRLFNLFPFVHLNARAAFGVVEVDFVRKQNLILDPTRVD